MTDKHYLPREIWLFGPFSWKLYTSDVQNDITIAEHLTALQPETATWQASRAGETEPQWKTVVLHEHSPFNIDGLNTWLVYANQQFNQGLIAKDLPDASNILWKQQIEPPAGRQLVIEFETGKTSPTVNVNGNTIEPVSGAFRGVTIYWVGKGGSVEITAPAGLVPQESIVAGEAPGSRIEVAVGSTVKINSPLVKTAGGAIRFPVGARLPRAHSMVTQEINPAGAASYTISIPVAGFYEISCRVRSLSRAGRVFHVAVDSYHGPGDVISGKPSAKWEWVDLNQPIALGAGTHTLGIWFFEPGAGLDQIRIGPVAGQAQLEAPAR